VWKCTCIVFDWMQTPSKAGHVQKLLLVGHCRLRQVSPTLHTTPSVERPWCANFICQSGHMCKSRFCQSTYFGAPCHSWYSVVGSLAYKLEDKSLSALPPAASPCSASRRVVVAKSSEPRCRRQTRRALNGGRGHFLPGLALAMGALAMLAARAYHLHAKAAQLEQEHGHLRPGYVLREYRLTASHD
jgi:hypothetical protein